MTTKVSKINRFALTWWIYIVFIPGLTFIPFAYAGFSSKDRKLVYFSYIYFLEIIIAEYLPSLCAIMWVAGIIHIFSIKNKYIDRRLELRSNDFNNFYNFENADTYNEASKKEIVKIKMEEELREEISTNITQQDNNLVKENEGVRLDLGEDDNELIDINYCSEEELEKLPFINSILAKKAIQQREAIGSFSSVEEFGISIGLKPHIIEKIRPLVIARELDKKEDKKGKGRVIDL